jgi:hypothetical protein
MFVAQGSVSNSPDYTPQQANDAARAFLLAGLGFLCFAGILLMLKIREARRVHLYGYDDSPWTLRHLWSWTIFVVPLLLSFLGVFSVFAAMTGIADTPPSATGGNLVFTVICGAVTLGGWVLGNKMRRASAAEAERYAVEYGRRR